MFFLTLCLIFIIRLRFPTKKSIAESIGYTYLVLCKRSQTLFSVNFYLVEWNVPLN